MNVDSGDAQLALGLERLEHEHETRAGMFVETRDPIADRAAFARPLADIGSGAQQGRHLLEGITYANLLAVEQ